MSHRRKLIEVALPLEAINEASAREKSIRHGHPSTLHLWWARRPLAAARAVIFSQMVDDPASCPEEFPTPEAQQAERQRLFDLIEELVKWENTTNEQVLERARAEIRRSWARHCLGGERVAGLSDAEIAALIDSGEIPPLPAFHDPFAGGGALPLEAQRLGLEAYASDLNPVAVLINKAMIEIPPRFAGMPPVNPDARKGGLFAAAETAALPGSTSTGIRRGPTATPTVPGARASSPHAPGTTAQASPPADQSSSPTSREHRQWHSRGYLPHFDRPGLIQSITFRLADSVPAAVIEQWKAELRYRETRTVRSAPAVTGVSGPTATPPGTQTSSPTDAPPGTRASGPHPQPLTTATAASDAKVIELRQRIANYEDAGHGECLLKHEAAARIVQNALLHFDGQRYRLLAWCVMPNHVHVLIETLPGHPLSDVVHSWKSYTSKEINRLLNRSGRLWMPDYFDRFIRDEEHLAAEVEYIESNPVKAGLVQRPDQWPFSSAGASPARGGATTRASRPQVSPARSAAGTAALPRSAPEWKGASGLAEDVRYYGQWMRDEAEKRIGHLYPKVKITEEMARERPDLEKYVGQELTVIAWLWARTVKSPNPAFRHVDVPLASTFMLSTKKGKEAYVEPVLLGTRASGPLAQDAGDAAGTAALPGYRFVVRVGKPKNPAAAKAGTKLGRGANFKCIMSDEPMSPDYIKSEGKAGRMGARLMAIVAEGDRGRVYLSPTPEHEVIAHEAKPTWKPETPLPDDPRNFWTLLYGLTTYGHLFTPRQLVALTTFSDLVGEAMERVRADALAAGLPDDPTPLRDGGTGATAYAEAVEVYLALGVNRLADRSSTICGWDSGYTKIRNTFGRQAIPMTWDYAEGNPYSESTGNFGSLLEWVYKFLRAADAETYGVAVQADASCQTISQQKIISTDPPYYDNVGYADLSDYFFVWLRRALRPAFPELFATLAVPKAEELVATPYRHGNKENAEKFFLDGMTEAMRRLAEQAHSAYPVTIYYAFKQAERKGTRASGPQQAAGTAALPTVSTGWETFLDAVIRSGFGITGTWPIRTELANRMIGSGTNALASSIVLVCRKRPEDAPTATRREFVNALKKELPAALRVLQGLGPGTRASRPLDEKGRECPAADTATLPGIAPVDLAQAAIGPGMAVYTRYRQVLDAEGQPVSVRDALALINQVLDEALAEQEGDFDADTRWALAWFDQHGFDEGEYGTAETLSKAKNTSVAGMVEAGIIESRRGHVRLIKPDELPEDWDPDTDTRLTHWEVVHHLIRALETGGEAAAADLVRRLGSRAGTARELAYRLYTICERKKRAAEALAYNALVQSWPEITRLARETAATEDSRQQELFAETEE